MTRSGLRHTLRIAAASTLGLACMFYPFMPGSHDSLAVALSTMAQVLGWTGLLMVPIGGLWFAHELADRRNRRIGSATSSARRHYLAYCAIGASLVVAAGTALAALIQVGPSLSVATLAIAACVVRRSLVTVGRLKATPLPGFNPTPLYLIIVPSTLVCAHLVLFPAAVESSRKRTIAGAERLIAAIEEYRAERSRYPISLASVHHDYDPTTVGVERYHYEPQGGAYNVYFEHLTVPIGTQEFVMYNPLGQHSMIVHNQDTLEAPSGQVEQERQFHARAARDAGVSRWKYFWFD